MKLSLIDWIPEKRNISIKRHLWDTGAFFMGTYVLVILLSM